MLNLKNTLDGYLKNVEVVGNTIQNTNNLADIRSVGDKVEGQELYKIDVVSCGKNVFDGEFKGFNVPGTPSFGNTNISKELGKVTFNANAGSFSFKCYLKQGVEYILSFDVSEKTSHYMTLVNSVRADYTDTQSKKRITRRFVSKGEDVIVVGIYGTFDNPSTLSNFQIEESNVATPYEPYKENKLEILSPVQLEKVGDVADRIICKDGVWGVEKNINVFTLSGQERILIYLGGRDNRKVTEVYQMENVNYSELGIIRNGDYSLERLISNKFTGKYYCWDSDIPNKMSFHPSINNIYFSVDKTIDTVDKFREHISGTIIKFPTSHSQFIPLPQDQQVKLRTFAGQTNIAFLTEIPGQIKAQVPKSLGATVNTHTEQIADLHNSLDRVKKLEETTVSTVETESNFTTVDATNNGYFEDVKLEGKTLTTVFTCSTNKHYNKWTEVDYINHKTVEIGKVYTIIAELNNSIQCGLKNEDDVYLLALDSSAGSYYCKTITFSKAGKLKMVTDYDGIVNMNVVILEGDHTNNPPSYFEGLTSVGQDVEEVSVESVNENLFSLDGFSYNQFIRRENDKIVLSGLATGTSNVRKLLKLKPNTKYTISIKAEGNQGSVLRGSVNKNASWQNDLISMSYDRTKQTFITPSDGIINIGFVCDASKTTTVWDIKIEEGAESTLYTPHQSNKKPLLYFNPTTETWEKPILREWDTIEKHSDGKYYYHKRSNEMILNGSENAWNIRTDREMEDTQLFTCNIGGDFVTNGNDINLISDKFNSTIDTFAKNIEGFYRINGYVYLRILKSKLTTQDVSGFKAWFKANPTTVVYQLAQEEVYECTNIDLMTYIGETNYIINSGAISPKSILKVHNNISNVVRILQEKVSLLENMFISGLKSVLSGDMYSLATILYPEDFEQNDNTEQDIMVIPE